MTPKAYFILATPAVRALVCETVQNAPEGYAVFIEPPNRTKAQNALFWVYMEQLQDNAYYPDENDELTIRLNKNAWAEVMRREILGTDRLPNGDTYGRSTRDLTVKEFNDFLAECECIAAERFRWAFRVAA